MYLQGRKRTTLSDLRQGAEPLRSLSLVNRSCTFRISLLIAPFDAPGPGASNGAIKSEIRKVHDLFTKERLRSLLRKLYDWWRTLTKVAEFGRGVGYLWSIGWRVWGYGYRSVRAVMRRVWGYGSCETARVWVSVRVMEIVIFICENLRFALVRSSFSPAKI